VSGERRAARGDRVVGRIKERSDADPATVLAGRRMVVRCRIGASLDSAYFDFSDALE
jgi:hypothetical protein